MAEKTLITEGDPEASVWSPTKHHFRGADFLPAPEVEKVAVALIATKSEFAHLEKWRITYVWKREAGKKAGKAVLGTCAKAAGLVKFFGECDFVVAIAADSAGLMTNWQLEALVYHELCHADEEELENEETGEVIYKPKLIGHDAELFGAEVRAYGAWMIDLVMVGDAYAQAPLFASDPTPMLRASADEATREFVRNAKQMANRDGVTMTIESAHGSATIGPDKPANVAAAREISRAEMDAERMAAAAR